MKFKDYITIEILSPQQGDQVHVSKQLIKCMKDVSKGKFYSNEDSEYKRKMAS